VADQFVDTQNRVFTLCPQTQFFWYVKYIGAVFAVFCKFNFPLLPNSQQWVKAKL